MAEAYFNSLALQRPGASWLAGSAGICAAAGAPASEQARTVMAEYGIDLDGFRSSPLTRDALLAAGLVIAMSGSHLSALRQFCPEGEAKYHLLLEWGEQDGAPDVPDPFGGSVAVYRHCFETMRGAVERIFQILNS